MYEHFATSNFKNRLTEECSEKSAEDNRPEFGNHEWDLKEGGISECRNMKEKVRQIYGSRRVMTMTRMNEKNNKITNKMKSNTKVNLQMERLNQNKKQNKENHSIKKKENQIKEQPNPSIQCQTLIEQNTKCKNLFASEEKPYRETQIELQSQPQPQTKSQNFTLPTEISTLLSQALLQNNESMQKMNESVMNRLLTIIENNQQSIRNSANMSMGYSRCSHINKHHHEGEAIGSLSHSLNQSNHPEFEETTLRQIKNKNEEKQSVRREEIVYKNMMETSKLRSQEKGEKKREKDDEILEIENQTAKMNDKRKERQFNYLRPKICTAKHELSNAENENISCERNQIIDKNGSILHQSPIQTAKNCSSPRTSSQNSNTNFNSTQKIELFSENKAEIEYSEIAEPLIETSVQLKTKFSNTVPIPTIMEICLPTSDTRNCSKAKDRPYRPNKAVLIEPTHNHPTPILTSEKITSFEERKPVYLEIASDDKDTSGFGGMSLAEAFKKRIGKLPSKAERMENSKINQMQSLTPKISPHKIKSNKENNHKNSHKTLVLDIKTMNKSESYFITPKSREPSEQLLNRLVGGSKVKVSKKEMYSLTKKNYEKLPEVQDRKKSEIKRQLELDRLERIKEYQKSIRASKSTIISNN